MAGQSESDSTPATSSAEKGHRGNAVDDRGVKSIIPDSMEVEKVVGVTGFFKEKK